AGADIEELAQAGFLRQVPDRAGQKAPGSASDNGDTRENLLVLVTGLAVDGIIVLAAQPVVPDPGRVRHGRVDPSTGGPSLGSPRAGGPRAGGVIRPFRPFLRL